MTIRQAIDQYGRETDPKRAAIVRRYIEWGGDTSDGQFTRYLRLLADQGLAPGTVDLHRRTIRAFYRRSNIIPPKAKGFRYDHLRDSHRPALAPETVTAMIRAAREGMLSDRETALLALSTTYGMRAEELASVREGDIDREGSRIFVRTAKHGVMRWCWLPPAIVPHLAIPWEGGASDVYAAFDSIWAAVSDAPKPRMAWHAVRRSLVAGLDRAGVPDSAKERFLRWASGRRSMASLYSNPSEEVTATGTAPVRDEEEGAREHDAAVWDAHPFLGEWS